jgi:hypothetical protein
MNILLLLPVALALAGCEARPEVGPWNTELEKHRMTQDRIERENELALAARQERFKIAAELCKEFLKQKKGVNCPVLGGWNERESVHAYHNGTNWEVRP